MAYLVNTSSKMYPSALVTFFEVRDFDGDIAVDDPCGKVRRAEFLDAEEACRVLESFRAIRAETEPIIAYLRGGPLGRVWTCRDNTPA
ncbi:hypothetical protein ACFVRB_26825 [Streptomyces nojiriensis]|uniref:hypothetical protein n=1 Tax=Streptomyces nojiriensis TaxID=66374 RepID=UPI0036DCA3AE